MSDIKKLQERIAQTVVQDSQEGAPVRVNTRMGVMVSVPGTEKVMLDTKTFQFMECQSAARNSLYKARFCIVEKVLATYGNQYINSEGYRVHVVTRDLYELLLNVVSSSLYQIKDLRTKNEALEEQVEVHKQYQSILKNTGLYD